MSHDFNADYIVDLDHYTDGTDKGAELVALMARTSKQYYKVAIDIFYWLEQTAPTIEEKSYYRGIQDHFRELAG